MPSLCLDSSSDSDTSDDEGSIDGLNWCWFSGLQYAARAGSISSPVNQYDFCSDTDSDDESSMDPDAGSITCGELPQLVSPNDDDDHEVTRIRCDLDPPRDVTCRALPSVDTLMDGPRSHISAPCCINDTPAALLVDSGANCNALLLTRAAADRCSLSVVPLKPGQPTFISLMEDGKPVAVVGSTTISELAFGARVLRGIDCIVVESVSSFDPNDGVIALPLFPMFGLSITGVPINYPSRPVAAAELHLDHDPAQYERDRWLDQHQIPQADRQQLLDALDPLLAANAAIKSGTFCSHPSSVVPVDTGEATPVFVPQYKQTEFISGHIDAQVQEWLADGIITDAPADTRWNSPLIGAYTKADMAKGKKPRVCIDPRAINRVLPKDPRPTPVVADVLRRLQGFYCISEFDLRKSYNQFSIRPEDRPKLAFTWRGRKYMFCGAPFGLSPMSMIFQATMEQILYDMQDFAIVFIDNVYVFTKGSVQDHIGHCSRVLQALTDNQLRVNAAKCHFGYQSIVALGHVISADSRSPDPAKLEVLKDWPVPATGADVESFLGFVNYMRDHVPLYSEVAAPLEALRKMGTIGDRWNDDCQRSFETIKAVLFNAPVLKTPLPGVPLRVAADASQYGIGAVLYQYEPSSTPGNPVYRFIMFAARALSGSQRNYGATRRELLSVVWSIEKFRDWLYGVRFTMETDHKALTYLFTQKIVNYMMLGWIDTLLEYEFDVVHCPGILHVLPDALSRMYTAFRRGGGEVAVRAFIPVSELPKYPEKQLSNFIQELFLKESVPESERQAKMEAAHAKGHYGADELFRQLWEDGYYWPFMKKDCRTFVATCLVCLRYNVGKKGYHPLQTVNAELPFDHISVDTITGLPTTPRGNNCILVIIDLFTRFTILYAQQTKSAVDTAWSLWQCFCLFPLPKIIQSDNGTEFVNSVLAELKKLLGVQHRLIAAYNPRANGSAENTVGNTQRVLRKITNGDLNDWDLHLPAVNLSLNTHLNAATQTTPSSVVFGVACNSFADYSRAESRLLSDQEFIERAEAIRTLVRPTIHEKFLAVRGRRVDAVNAQRAITDALPIGTQVMVADPVRSTKHQPFYTGPYTVVKQKRGGTYVLQDIDKSLFPRDVPRDQLKPIAGEVPADDIYTVEKIIDHKGPANKRLFLVKWRGYPTSENTWEPESNLLTCQELLAQYWSFRQASNQVEEAKAVVVVPPSGPAEVGGVVQQAAAVLPAPSSAAKSSGRQRRLPPKLRD
jgi:hypothetical protein